jgi:hypothetical protein
MKKYRFGSLIRHRKERKNEAVIALRNARNTLTNEIDLLSQLQTQKVSVEESKRISSLQRSQTAGAKQLVRLERITSELRMLSLEIADQIYIQKMRIEAARNFEQQACEELEFAAREVRIFERHRERWVAAEKVRLTKLSEKILSEAAINNFIRRKNEAATFAVNA